MSIPADLTLRRQSAGTNVTFITQSKSAQETQRINSASTLVEPELIVIRHNLINAKGVGPVDRHNLQYSKTESDGTGAKSTLVVNVTAQVPRTGMFSSAEVSNALGFLVASANSTTYVGGAFITYLSDLLVGAS